MIIIKIQGGLGNQLFQYAMGRSLAEYLKQDLLLDVYHLQKPVAGHLERSYMLNRYPIKAQIAEKHIIEKFYKKSFCPFFNKKNIYIKQLVFDENPPSESVYKHIRFFVKDKTYMYYNDIFNLHFNSIYLDGYWQSYKNFELINNELYKELSTPLNCTQANSHLVNSIINCQAVAVHIRKSDYVSTDFGKTYFKNLNLLYYTQAISLLTEKFPNLHFFIFSDDVAWCKIHFKTDFLHTFVEGHDPVSDVYLMHLCKHHITANSTFSWWGAWLCNNKDKIIISPKQWYNTVNEKDMNDLLPANWIKL